VIPKPAGGASIPAEESDGGSPTTNLPVGFVVWLIMTIVSISLSLF
jgi:hypothetical protein